MVIAEHNALLLVAILVLSALLQLVIVHKHQRRIDQLEAKLLQTKTHPNMDSAEESETAIVSRQP